MKKMIKKQAAVNLEGYSLGYIKDVLIPELISSYGDHAELTLDCGYGNIVEYEREETDEEYAERLENEASEIDKKKRQLEKLQKEIEEMEDGE